jgi:hypothetical protein
MLNLPTPVLKWMTLLLPPVAILVCCFVMVPRQKKLRSTHAEVRVTQSKIRDYIQQLSEIKALPPDPQIATLPMTKEEQSDFLRAISQLCKRSGNRLVSVSSLAAPPPAPPPPSGSGPAAKPDPLALPPEVTEVRTTIHFEGHFNNLRAFLAGLQRWPRLISLRDCRVGVGQGGHPNLLTAVTVARYLDAPKPGEPPMPRTAAAQGGANSQG